MSNLNELSPIQALSPFKRFCCTIGNIPSSYVVSMSYEELTYWLCDYLKNTVIPTLNNNAYAVQELQNFVTNYFENLDVQDEINNKLDEMVKDGTFIQLISNYLSYVTPEMFGAIGDGTTDDTESLQDTIDYAHNNKLKVRLLAKDYKISDTLTLYDSISIEGINRGGSITNKEISRIIRTTDDEIFDLTSLRNVSLSDISFYDDDDYTTPQIQLSACYMFNFTNLFFSSNARHLNFKNRNFDSRLNNCFFGGSSNTSVYFEDANNGANGCNEINFNDCHWEHYTTTALHIGEYNHDLRFNNCKFESIYTNNINSNIITLYKCGNIYFSETSLNVNTIFNSVIYQESVNNIQFNGQLTLTDTSNNIINPFIRCKGSCNFDYDISISNININKYINDYLMYFEDTTTNFITNSVTLKSNWTSTYFVNAGKKLSNITLNRKYTQIGNSDLTNIQNRSGETTFIDSSKNIIANRITNPSNGVFGVSTLFNIDGSTTVPQIVFSDGRTQMQDIVLTPSDWSITPMNHLKFHNASIGAMLVIGCVTGTNKQLRIGCSDSAPATGEYKTGDIVFNFSPSSGEPIGWVCINSGNPGTWKSFGTIDS